MKYSRFCGLERGEVSTLPSLLLPRVPWYHPHCREVVETHGNQGNVCGGGVYEEAAKVREVHQTDGSSIQEGTRHPSRGEPPLLTPLVWSFSSLSIVEVEGNVSSTNYWSEKEPPVADLYQSRGHHQGNHYWSLLSMVALLYDSSPSLTPHSR